MKPVAWIKVRELTAMKAVAEYGKTDWRTNLGLVPESGDEGLYTETQVQDDTALLRQALEWIEAQPEPRMIGSAKLIVALKARLEK